MRSRHLIQLMALLIVLACAAIVLSPPARRVFRANKVDYLINGHRYAEALAAGAELTADDPKAGRRLGDYGTRILDAAYDHYAAFPRPMPPRERAACDRLLAATAAIPRLAPHGRQMNLDLLTRATPPDTSATLAAARAILNTDGYDERALWWAVKLQYDPARPLEIPGEITTYRDQLSQPPLESQTTDSLQLRRHGHYLRALAALAERDWSRAVTMFEAYDRLNERDGLLADRLTIPHAMALLAIGRADRAAALLESDRFDAPELACQARLLLLEAQLVLRQIPLAAALFHALRNEADCAARARALIARLYGLPPGSSQADWFSALPASTAPAQVWELLEDLAENDGERARLSAAAAGLLNTAGRADAAGNLAMIDFALRRRDRSLVATLAANGALLTEHQAGPALASAVEFLAMQDAETTAVLPLAQEPLGVLLTRNGTLNREFLVPAGARLMIFMIQGYPVDGAWPILHLRLDAGEARVERTCYNHDARSMAQPLALVLPRREPGASPLPVRVSISLLNAGDGTGRQDRNALLAEMLAF